MRKEVVTKRYVRLLEFVSFSYNCEKTVCSATFHLFCDLSELFRAIKKFIEWFHKTDRPFCTLNSGNFKDILLQ